MTEEVCATTPHWLAVYVMFGIASLRIATLITAVWKLWRNRHGQTG